MKAKIAPDFRDASLGRKLGIAVAVALGFVCLMSNPKVADKPVRPEMPLRTVESWLDPPQVRLISGK